MVGSLGIIKKGKDKEIDKIPSSPGLYEIQKKLHFAEHLISYVTGKKIIQKRPKRIRIHIMTTFPHLKSWGKDCVWERERERENERQNIE